MVIQRTMPPVDSLSRRADVFVYGLFVDETLLRAKGLTPVGAERALLKISLSESALVPLLVPRPGSCVHGIVFSLTLSELEQLYSEPRLQVRRAGRARAAGH